MPTPNAMYIGVPLGTAIADWFAGRLSLAFAMGQPHVLVPFGNAVGLNDSGILRTAVAAERTESRVEVEKNILDLVDW